MSPGLVAAALLVGVPTGLPVPIRRAARGPTGGASLDKSRAWEKIYDNGIYDDGIYDNGEACIHRWHGAQPM